MTFVSACTDWCRATGIRFFFGPVLEILYCGGWCYVGRGQVCSTQMIFSCVAAVDSEAVLLLIVIQGRE
jgi:hypothetical protein